MALFYSGAILVQPVGLRVARIAGYAQPFGGDMLTGGYSGVNACRRDLLLVYHVLEGCSLVAALDRARSRPGVADTTWFLSDAEAYGPPEASVRQEPEVSPHYREACASPRPGACGQLCP